MRRAAGVCAAAGVLALAAAALALGREALPSYFAAWVLFLGVPVGALAVTMMLEVAGAGDLPLAAALRLLLPALPVMAVSSIPVLLGMGSLYPAQGGWLSEPLAVVRAAVILAVWSVAALVFMRPPRRPGGRTALAVAGSMLHLVFGTALAADWAQMTDPAFASSAFGLLTIIAQCSLAVAVAILLGEASGRRADMGASAAVILAAMLGAWMFMEFTQFLVVWSANLPAEVAWYQRRDAGVGRIAERIAATACAVALATMLPRRLEVLRATLMLAAGLVVLAHVIRVLWLVVPRFRGALTLTAGDGLALGGLACLLLAAPLAFAPRPTVRRGAA